MLDETVSSTRPESNHIPGVDLAQQGNKAQGTLISVQVIPMSAGDFEVQFKGGVVTPHGEYELTRIGTFANDGKVLLSAFPVSLNCMYGFTHISGVACKVRIGG